jgi:hypothetical protein
MKINTILKLDELRVDIIDTLDKQAKSSAGRDIALDDLWRRFAALAEECQNVEREQKILKSLTFKAMKQRQEKIKDAHKRTLGWIFKKPETGFLDWLQTENGIYWVKGKAS